MIIKSTLDSYIRIEGRKMRTQATACILLTLTLGALLMVARLATASEMEPSDQWAYNFSYIESSKRNYEESCL